MLEIFNIIIGGETLDKFLALDTEQKKEFIKKHTNQQNDKVIDDFLSRPFKGVQPCVNCGELNNKIENPFKNGDISERVPTKAVESEQNNGSKRDSKRTNTKRRNGTKNA